MKKLFIFLFLVAAASGDEKFDCSKRYCKEMSSCDEAIYYFKKCGRDNFDRDGDGIPCKNVCGEKSNKSK
ncbi:MAG: excalibur calcium-binding domain-containing protein [Campylobacter sp.]|nr:excalibur calcium-binding domain-containing protein [Campylobacter sp.]